MDLLFNAALCQLFQIDVPLQKATLVTSCENTNDKRFSQFYFASKSYALFIPTYK